jgi:hypothetical protein
MIWLYGIINALTLAWGFRYARRVGYRTVVPFVVSLALLLVYCLITPLGFYLTGRETATGDGGYFRFVGKRITDYYEPGMLAYMIANLSFLMGFLRSHTVDSGVVQTLSAASMPSLRRLVVWVYVACLCIVLADVILSGINLFDVLLGSADENLMASQSASNTYYFRAFADSIITVLVLYAYLNGSRRNLILLLIPAFVLFALLGFRYRMILTALGLLLVYGLRYGAKINGWRWVGISVALLYFVFTITYNRWFFITGAYDRITLNPAEYSYSMFLDQTRGSLVDFNLLRYYDANPRLSHDYGLSMFGYVVVRVVPRQFFPSGQKPYPSPFIDVLDKSLELPATWLRIGEATLHYGAFYAAFGWIGFLIMPLVMGWWLSYVIRRNPSTTPLGFLKQIAFSLALFQFITRGYFPQFVDHFVYLSIPLWLIGGRIRAVTATESTITAESTVIRTINEAVY